MSLNLFENGRSPEFIQEMIEAAQKVRDLRAKILRHEIALDEAAKQINDDPRYRCSHTEVRSLIARGLPLEYCTRPQPKAGQ